MPIDRTPPTVPNCFDLKPCYRPRRLHPHQLQYQLPLSGKKPTIHDYHCCRRTLPVAQFLLVNKRPIDWRKPLRCRSQPHQTSKLRCHSNHTFEETNLSRCCTRVHLEETCHRSVP